jgi:dTDP-4-amino-4,6-dideoxygalactose transaminase
MSISNKQIYLSSPHMSGREMKYIQEAFDQNWIAPMGPNVDKFEKSLAKYCGVNYVTALSSGTAAIHLALIVLGIERGDEVIASSFTFSATINPIVYQGALPILIDCEPGTWNMDPEILETAIKDRISKGKKPKAIIPVHLYGMPANMSEIMAVANKYDIPVIEDAAEALGSKYKNNRMGSMGTLGVLSFNGNKIITTSGGGALIGNEECHIKRARFLATQARNPAPHYQHSKIGYNYRMSNIVAGIGRGQLEVIEERVQRRRSINRWYRDLLADIPGITFSNEPSEDYFSNCWLTCIVIDPEKAGTDRKKLQLAFGDVNIETRPLWKPMHLQPVFAGSPAYLNGTSEKLFQNGLCLPSGSNLTDIELNRILEVFKREFKVK